MMDDQIELRHPIMSFLQGAESVLQSDNVIIGLGMVMEFIGPDGMRHVRKLTSDASGRPMPYYMAEAYAEVLASHTELDEVIEE